MNKSTYVLPNVPVSKFKRTKIIASIGPATNSYEKILWAITAGANGVRLNFSHGTHEEKAQHIKWAREAANEYGKPVSIIQDLQGPKIRLGDFEGEIHVHQDKELAFGYEANYEETGIIPTQYDLATKLKTGERVKLVDGKISTVVTNVQDGIVHVKAENSGILSKRKGMNLPDTDFGGDIITEKDKEDILFGSKQDIDYVALSFVQSADDIKTLRKMLADLGSDAHVIAKIETKAAIENLEDIVKEADAIMVARGDLATETSPESVPVVQYNIITLGLKYAKPTIVATQMMASMTDNPEPTRAEVSDVANAAAMGADCVMLSDETAMGMFPIEAIKTMKKVLVYTQANMPSRLQLPDKPAESSTEQAISDVVIGLGDSLKAKAIVVETRSGNTALKIAARRPDRPIIVITSEDRTANQLAIAYGAKNYIRPADKMAATKLTNWLRENEVLHSGELIVSVSGKYPGVVGTTDTIKVRVLE
jgi:pyruvate kinase